MTTNTFKTGDLMTAICSGLTPAQQAIEDAKAEALRRAERYRQASGMRVLPVEIDQLADWLQNKLKSEVWPPYDYTDLARRILAGEWRG